MKLSDVLREARVRFPEDTDEPYAVISTMGESWEAYICRVPGGHGNRPIILCYATGHTMLDATTVLCRFWREQYTRPNSCLN